MKDVCDNLRLRRSFLNGLLFSFQDHGEEGEPARQVSVFEVYVEQFLAIEGSQVVSLDTLNHVYRCPPRCVKFKVQTTSFFMALSGWSEFRLSIVQQRLMVSPLLLMIHDLGKALFTKVTTTLSSRSSVGGPVVLQ